MTSRKKNPANSSPIALKRSSIEILSRFLANCKKTFPSAQVLISSEIYKDFCKIPHLAITGHAPLPRFDRILKSVLKQFKKNQKNIKPSRCILIYVLVTIQTNKLGIMKIY